MGVKGLLQALKPIIKEVSLAQFRNQRAGIDGYAWLHKAAFTDLDRVVSGKTVSDKPTKFCLRKLERLRAYDITPLVVVDGRPLLAKKDTNLNRHSNRAAQKEKASRLQEEGDAAGAHRALGQAVSITWPMVEHLLNALKSRDIDFIVAPYEADAQLGYLSKSGYVDLVISEDSDLLLYGCQKVLFKLDDAGRGELVDAQDIPSSHILPASVFSHDAFIHLCSLAGCDYTDGIKGLGLKKGAKIVSNAVAKLNRNQENLSPRRTIKQIAQEVASTGMAVDEEKEDELLTAYLTFKYQTVYDPEAQTCVAASKADETYINDYKEFLGLPLTPKTTKMVCGGRLEPKSLKPTLVQSPVKQAKAPTISSFFNRKDEPLSRWKRKPVDTAPINWKKRSAPGSNNKENVNNKKHRVIQLSATPERTRSPPETTSVDQLMTASLWSSDGASSPPNRKAEQQTTPARVGERRMSAELERFAANNHTKENAAPGRISVELDSFAVNVRAASPPTRAHVGLQALFDASMFKAKKHF